MAGTDLLKTNGTFASHPDWPTLIGRAVDDVSRILQSEAHMFQTVVRSDLEARLASALTTLITLAVIVCGAMCMLCASILLLHQWLPWWQAFGVSGLSTLSAGIASHVIMNRLTKVSLTTE